KLADPARPDVAADRWLDEVGHLPGPSAIGAELDLLDAAPARKGDAADVVVAGRKFGIRRGQVNARHRLDDRLPGPVSLGVPIREIALHWPQSDDPLRVFHAVTPWHEQASG